MTSDMPVPVTEPPPQVAQSPVQPPARGIPPVMHPKQAGPMNKMVGKMLAKLKHPKMPSKSAVHISHKGKKHTALNPKFY